MARDKQQALQAFWSQFGKAYDENTVEDKAVLPYITYESVVSSFGDSASMTASIWDRSDSWKTVTQILNNISETIGLGGCSVPYDGGMIWITKGTPFAQRMGDTDDTIRRIVLNIEAEYISAD